MANRRPDLRVGETTASGATETAETYVAGGEDERTKESTGASVTSVYHNWQQHIVGVEVNDLRDFRSGRVDEFRQFVIGEFLAAGSFWLGLERIATAKIWNEDVLFWICVVAFIAGLTIGYFAYKQLTRRQTRIDRIIEAAMRDSPDSAST